MASAGRTKESRILIPRIDELEHTVSRDVEVGSHDSGGRVLVKKNALARREINNAQRSRRPYRVVVHGLPHFCEKLPGLLRNEMWDVRFHAQHSPIGLAALVADLRRCDLAYTWGGRISMGKFLWAARFLGNKKTIILWCGSDVLDAQKGLAHGGIDPWIAERTHWAVSPTLAEEVRSLGLNCEYVQASFVSPIACPKPLPQKFSVLVFLPTAERTALYGWDRVIDVARELPSVEFKLVGLRDITPPPAPPNVIVHHWIADLTAMYEQSTVLWRPVRHDAGISFMVLEALSHGRHVLYTYPFPGCFQADGVESSRRQIERFLSLHNAGALRLNQDGIDAVAERYSREAVRSELRTRWEKIIHS
jgi:hypothetical protein